VSSPVHPRAAPHACVPLCTLLLPINTRQRACSVSPSHSLHARARRISSFDVCAQRRACQASESRSPCAHHTAQLLRCPPTCTQHQATEAASRVVSVPKPIPTRTAVLLACTDVNVRQHVRTASPICPHAASHVHWSCRTPAPTAGHSGACG
jgi:hypothetical protein